MTLAESLLPRLSEWSPSGSGRHSWSETFPENGWTVHLAADKADSLAALVWELTLTRTAAAPAGLTLASWATQIADRVSGLIEDLKVVEVDASREEALLRSDDPSRKGEAVSYYEIRLTGVNRAVVRRFQANATVGTRREQVAFALTHESLANLAGNISG